MECVSSKLLIVYKSNGPQLFDQDVVSDISLELASAGSGLAHADARCCSIL